MLVKFVDQFYKADSVRQATPSILRSVDFRGRLSDISWLKQNV